MRTAAIFSLILLALSAGPAASAPKAPADGRAPVLVELFTAQGCAACKDANSYLAKLAERPGVTALTFSVDYWDYLGWTDTFARPEFTERQKAYVNRLKLREPYTPQLVIDGREQVQAQKTAEADRLIRQAGAGLRNPPDIRFVGRSRVDVGQARAPKGGAEVWLIRYDPHPAPVEVKAGDNRGQTVTPRNVVREMTRLGLWRGQPKAFRISPGDEGLKTVVLVQVPKGGRVLGVGRPKA